jgi:uncharacterized membrane protein YhaH (DUF805 family)
MSGTIFCRACGASINAAAPLCPQCGAPQGQNTIRVAHAGDGIRRDFANSVRICFQKYATFQGRAPRAEYWLFFLFSIIIGLALGFVIGIARVALHVNLQFLSYILDLALVLPGISVAVRRLHDLDKSGWWYWLGLIPVIGWIILLVWYCTRGTVGDNQYGAENGETMPQYRN